MRLLLVVLLAACGASGPQVVCNIDAHLANDMQAFRAFTDCSHPADAMSRARDCVLDAVGRKAAFILAYDTIHPVNHLRSGFSGWPIAGGGMTFREYAYRGDDTGKPGDAKPAITQFACSAIAADPACVPAAGKACLTCNHTGTPIRLCGG